MWRHCQLIDSSRTKVLSRFSLVDWCPVHRQILWSSAVLASVHYHAEFVLDSQEQDTAREPDTQTLFNFCDVDFYQMTLIYRV